jgi:response regulator NasT
VASRRVTRRESRPLSTDAERLRVLIVNERPEQLALVRRFVDELGHDALAPDEIADVGELTRLERPDVAVVGPGESSDEALRLIEQIVHEAACPVIAHLEAQDSDWVEEAAQRGIFAYIVDGEPRELQSVLSIVLRRFAEYHNLEGAFGRRATIERAKGILMATHLIDEQEAFELLRRHSARTGRKLIDIAEAVVDSHRLLVAKPPS